MAMINGSSMFLSSKQKSRALKGYPKNVRKFLNIDAIHPNGIFKLEPGKGISLYDRCYVFEDINYANQNEDEKEGVLLLLMQWLNSMKADFKTVLSNEFRDMDKFKKEVLSEPNRDEYPEIAKGMSQWIQQKIEEGSPNIRKVRYLVVTCRAKSFEDAQIYFNTLDTQLKRLFTSWRSQLYRLNAKERLRSLHDFFRMGRENEFHYDDAMRKGDWKNHILPTHIDTEMNFMVMDGLYVSAMFGYNFSSSVDEGKLIYGLSNVSFPSIVTVDYAPVKRKVLKGKLENAHMNNEKAISDELERKRRNGQFASGISYRKEKTKQELEEYQDQVDDNNENAFFIGLIVVVTGNSEEELAQRVEQLKGIGEEQGVPLETYNHRQLKALNTALPFGGRQVDHMRPFLTSSAVALQPYHAQDVQEPGGMCYGSNRTTHRLIIGNRKKLPNPHGMIVGHTGSGKGMLVRETELSQSLLRYDDDITVLDPQNEYEPFIQENGGEFFDLTPQSKMRFNPFEISEEVFDASKNVKDKFVADQVVFANSLISAVMKNIIVTQEHNSVVSRSTRSMYEDAFKQKKRKQQPTLKILRMKIKHEMDQATNVEDESLARQIYNSLQEYTEGAYDMFAHESNISLKKRLTGFGLANVGEDMWEVAMLTIMHFLANRMEYNKKLQKATRLIIDESQVVCKNDTSAEILLEAILTYRKYGGVVTMCLQNLTRVLESEDLRDMFSNCAFKCFLDQGGVDAQALASVQELSAAEFQSLNEDTPGYGVMVWNNKVILFDAFMNEENILYEKFSTNFHEKAEKKKAEAILQTPVAETTTKMSDQKIKVLQMAELTPITVQEVELLLNIDEMEAKKLLHEMETEEQLVATAITGVVQYSKVC